MRARTSFMLLLFIAFVAQALAECANDPNAELGCDPTCSRRCNPPAECINVCNEETCRCKEGYRFDTANYKCVEAEDCPA